MVRLRPVTILPHWDWVASRHPFHLPPPLNQEDLADPPVEATDENMGLPFGLSRDRPSSLPISGDSALPKKVPKPPPPAHKGAASASLSPVALSRVLLRVVVPRGIVTGPLMARYWRPRRWCQ